MTRMLGLAGEHDEIRDGPTRLSVVFLGLGASYRATPVGGA
jgi:hypothetical protein